MTFKHLTPILLALALLLTSTAVPFYLSPPDAQQVGDNLVAPAATIPPSSAPLAPDAPAEARQENRNSLKDVPQNSADDGAARARVRDTGKGLVRLAGEVPAALASAERLPNTAAGDDPLTLTLVLNRTDQQGFEAFLTAVQDSKSPSYRHYLSQREQAERFGPSPQAYDAVRAWLRRKGFTVLHGSINRLTITIRGRRAQTEGAFGIRLDNYRLGNRTFYANDIDPALPGTIAANVQAVIGLSNIAQPVRPRGMYAAAELLRQLRKDGGDQTLASTCWLALKLTSGPEKELKEFLKQSLGASYSLSSISALTTLLRYACAADELGLLNQYVSNLPTQPTPASDRAAAPTGGSATAPPAAPAPGTGQKVALLEFDNFHPSDVKNFLNLLGQGSQFANLSQVHVAGGAGAPGADESEVLLDIDAVMSLAPGAEVVVYDGPFNGRGSFQTMFNAMISDGANVISNSWAYCEDQTVLADVQSIDSILASAAASGITVVTGSGDHGSVCLDGSPNTVHVPASSPHITAVGGTTPFRNVGGTFGVETWWDSSTDLAPGGQGGFGVSRFFTRPSYQDGHTSATMRSVPDVTVPADPAMGYFICQASGGGCPTNLLYGGTSVAAPIWAAFAAVMNQLQNRHLGFLNPLIYPLERTTAFHSSAELGSDFAHVGLGSPNVGALNLALSGGTSGPVSGSNSFVDAFPPIASADGINKAGVAVIVLDANGNSVSGQSVQLTMNSDAHAVITTLNSVTNVSNGAALFTVTDTVPETVTFTATGGTLPLSQHPTVKFVPPAAAAGGISASPTTVNANGSDTTTITVTLQDAKGNPSPGKVVNLSQGNGASIISATTATTDATGKLKFTAVDFTTETVTYTAVDVTDGNLPVPGSATVNFVNSSGTCARSFTGTAAPGYAVSTFASNFPIDCFTNRAPIGLAFDANRTLFVGDVNDSSIYRFGPQGGIAGPATLVGRIPPSFGNSLAGLTFTKDGRFYVGMNGGGQILELNPATGAVIRVVAQMPDGVLDMHQDPLSGDLFVTLFDGIFRISNFATGPGTVSLYLRGGFADGFVFAPDGTIYVKGGVDGVYRVPGTNAPQPVTATQLAYVVGGADGIALEANPANPSKPFLYVNRNDGVITRIDTSALPTDPPNCDVAGAPCTKIYTGGSRGDFVTVGPSGCLFATQSDRIIRVTKADGTCSLSPTNPAPQIVLTPENVAPSPAQGTSVTFTATLKNVANPTNIPITLVVAGPNSGPYLVSTDANGNASFSYTGVLTGTDRALAFATIGDALVSSNPAAVTWTPGRHTTFLNLNPSPTGGAPNKPLVLTATLADASATPPVAVSGVAVIFALAGQTCSGTTDGAGRVSCAITPNVAGGSYQLVATFGGTSELLASSAKKTVDLLETPVVILPVIQFNVTNYQVGEGNGRVVVMVNRGGDSSGAVSVDYQTVDTDTFRFGCADTVNNQGGAYGRCDFATVVGTLNFAAGETSKTITVPIIDDVHVEGDETFQVALANAVGATIGTPAAATITIKDNDTTVGAPNPVFRSDFFVRQHYLDFLSREPEPDGLAAWLRVLNNCLDVNNLDPNSPSAGCDRILVSQSFFGSPEFQLKGFYVFRFYKLAFNRLPEYLEIVADMSFVAGATPQEVFQRKAQLATDFTQRPEFQTVYGGLSNAGYVNTLLSRYSLTQVTTPDPANPDGTQKVTLTSAELISRLNSNTLTRAQVLRAIADSDQVGAAEFNNAFVGMQYYGYLRRKPEAAGFQAWLRVLQSGDIRTMVNGFLNSQEYKLRFGQP